MRSIKFQFLFKGLPFSATNPEFNWHKKEYYLVQLIDNRLDELCDLPSLGKLIAKRLFTGRYDNNSADIYEGDIISDHVGIGQVKYSEKHAAFRVVYSDGMAKWFYHYNLKGERESIEVIGNIHQNPELLENVK